MAIADDEAAVSTRAVYPRLLRALSKDWPVLVCSLTGFVLYAAGTVLIADLLQFLLDAISDAQRVDAGLVSGLTYRWVGATDDPMALARAVVPPALIAVALMRAAGHFLGQYSIAWLARSLVHRLRCQLYDAILSLPATVLDSESHGAWVGRLTYNVEQLAGAVTEAIKTLLRESLILIGLLAYMLYLNWQLCLVFVLVMPVVAWVVKTITRRFKQHSEAIQSAVGEVTQRAREDIAGYQELRLLGALAERRRAFVRASADNRQQNITMLRVEALAAAFLQVCVALAFGLMVWLALQPQWMSGLSAGVLVAFLTAASQLAKPVRQLAGVLGVLQRGIVAAQDAFLQIDRAAEPDEGTLAASNVEGRIDLRNVSFTYPGSSVPALEDISCTINAGEHIALVGRSGSGKSTLLRLLARLYPAGAGEMLLDGKPIARYRLQDYRQQVALVPQRPHLFRASVYNNIALGAGDRATPASVKRALDRAGAWDFVAALPQGMDTTLGDDGAGLSGGQQQRLAIARALLKDSPLLLLDEVTSALDSQTAAQVRQSLAAFARGRTCIDVAHRIATVEQADRILVLDAGRLVAQGTHAQLLAEGGLYTRLCEQELQA